MYIFNFPVLFSGDYYTFRLNDLQFSECETLSQKDNSSSRCSVTESIKPHEQRALNFLINEYLLLHGYKLTSITFADENEDQVS